MWQAMEVQTTDAVIYRVLQELKLHGNLQGKTRTIRGKRKLKTEKHATTSEAVLTDLVPFHELPGIVLEVRRSIISSNILSELKQSSFALC